MKMTPDYCIGRKKKKKNYRLDYIGPAMAGPFATALLLPLHHSGMEQPPLPARKFSQCNII